MRFGEAIELRGKDIRDKTLNISRSATFVRGKGYVIGPTKMHETRHVPVPSLVWEKLAVPDDDALVFPGKGGQLTNGEYRWAFDQAATRTGGSGARTA